MHHQHWSQHIQTMKGHLKRKWIWAMSRYKELQIVNQNISSTSGTELDMYKATPGTFLVANLIQRNLNNLSLVQTFSRIYSVPNLGISLFFVSGQRVNKPPIGYKPTTSSLQMRCFYQLSYRGPVANLIHMQSLKSKAQASFSLNLQVRNVMYQNIARNTKLWKTLWL